MAADISDTETGPGLRAEPVTESIPMVKTPPEGEMAHQSRFATWERALLALITGVIAFGGATGNVWVVFPACVVMVAVIFWLSAMPNRKRPAALKEEHAGQKRTGVIIGVVWVVIVLVVALVLFLVPARFALTGGVVAALLAVAAMWGALAYVDRPARA